MLAARRVLRALIPLILLIAHAAFAGRVVVLDITGDRHGRLRGQIEQAVRQARVLKLVPLPTYLAAAKGHGLSRVRAMTPSGVRALSASTALTIAVGGSVGRTFFVRIFDPAGFELWSHQLPVHKGLISAKNARRLAKAIEVAARQVVPPTQVAAGEEPGASQNGDDGALPYAPDANRAGSSGSGGEAGSGVAGAGSGSGNSQATPAGSSTGTTGGGTQPGASNETTPGGIAPGSPNGTTPDGASATGSSSGTTEGGTTALGASGGTTPGDTSTGAAPGGPSASGSPASSRPGTSGSSGDGAPGSGSWPGETPETSSLPDAAQPRPHWITIKLLGSTTFRSYCARPGVSACGQYDSLDPSQRPPGGTVQYDPRIPYAGLDLGLELFPFAAFGDFAGGFGLLAEYHRGYARTDLALQGQGGSTPTSSTRSIDSGYDAELSWRYFFSRGGGRVGYFGVRGGYRAISFDVDPSVAAVLPGSHRKSLVAGVEGAFPILRALRLEGAAELLPGAHPGPDEVVSFGTSGEGSGYAIELGLSGEIHGPFGYFAHARYSHFADSFSGAGTLWPSGGTSQESYLRVLGGVTVSF